MASIIHPCLTKEPIIGKSIRLRLAEMDDAAFILSLRMDGSRNKYVSVVDNDVERQREWLKSYKTREQQGAEYYFIIELLDGEPIGAVRIYDYQGNSFSWGSWIIKPGSPKTASIESALLVYETAFYTLMFERAHFNVNCANERVADFHRRMGAEIIATNDVEHTFIYSRGVYESIRGKYIKFLPTT